MYAGQRHCISFDFDADSLETILPALPQRTESSIRRDLVSGSRPASFKIDRVYCNHLKALLGRIEVGRHGSFVPLVITGLAIEPSSRP